MSEERTGRRPQVFKLDEAQVVFAPPDPEPDLAALEVAAAVPPKRGFSWSSLFWSALGGVVSLALGLAATQLIEDLFQRATWLGYAGAALVALLVLATLVILGRELAGLYRLASLDHIRARAAFAVAEDDRPAGEEVVRALLHISKENAALARGRAELEGHLSRIIDGADLVRLAERSLMSDLDARARQMIADAAKRVSVVTAVSPRAAVDLFFVLITAAGLIRRLARLYGGRPGTLGMLSLGKHVISHLAITGGMAAGDTLVQQLVGHGLAAKLSARLGEGVVNGLLTARLGLAAVAVTRPLPFVALPPPRMTDVASGLMRKADEEASATKPLRAPGAV